MDYDRLKKESGFPDARWICVFGTSDPADTQSVDEAERLGAALAKAGYVVLNGGYGAAMEGASRGAHRVGGYAFGVTCTLWPREPNSYLSGKVEAGSLLERLETLLRLGDGYVAARGGTGTLVEIALAWEYINKRIVTKRPLVLLGEFWSALVDIIGSARAAPGVSIGQASESITTAGDVDEAVRILNNSFAAKS
ncbi:MAG: LOG family protein [Gemmatimonadota bacterium]|nr:LOG family protein [Gemmatimonadota bacterium]